VSGVIGLLVMSYGAPRDMNDIETFYTHVRRGNPPPLELLREIEARYAAVGGVSPLMQRTRRQATALQEVLGAEDPRWRVHMGTKHQAPYLEDAVAQMAAAGIGTAVGLVLAPHYSRASTGEYFTRVEEAAQDTGLNCSFGRGFHADRAFIRMLAERVRQVRALIPDDEREGAPVVFTAHSLPAGAVEVGDPYAAQVEETARLVARELRTHGYETAWQSAGRTDEEWLGPDLCAVIARLGAKGARAVVCCPCGFVADNLEVLYDIDIEAQQAARDAGVLLVRTESPNADPEFVAVLRDVVLRHARERGL